MQAFIPETGKGIQGATSHALGQNFSKMFDIKYMADDKQERLVWQTSWGCTTRTLGVMVMTHGDDKGLVIPPRVASKQAVVVPITMATQTDEERRAMYETASQLAQRLTDAGVHPGCSSDPTASFRRMATALFVLHDTCSLLSRT